MSIRIPRDASIDVQASFRDVERELGNLGAPRPVEGDPNTELVARIEQVEKRPRLDSDKDTFVGSGPQSSAGLVPNPGGTADNEAVLLENGSFGYPVRGLVRAVTTLGAVGDTQTGADVVNVLGGLAVLGPLAADTVNTREVVIAGVLTVPGIMPLNAFNMRDDFLSGASAATGTIGQLGWHFAASAGGPTTTGATGVAGHPGYQSILSGTTNNAIGTLYHHSDFYPYLLSHIGRASFIVHCDAGQTGAFRCIATPSVLADNPAGTLGFECLVTDTNWFSITYDSAPSNVRKDTGVAFAANTWITLEFIRNKNAWDFYVNGVLKTTHTQGVDSVPDDTTAVQVVAQTKSNATSRTFSIDLIDVYGVVGR